MFLLAHSAFLGIHLLQFFVLGEALEQLLFEFVLHAELFRLAFGLESQLEVFRFLKLLLDALSLFHFGSLAGYSCLFSFLEVKLISQVFLELFFGPTLVLFSLKTFKNLVTGSFCSILCSLDLAESLLLLFGVSAHHFVFELLHLLLSLLERPFLVYAEDHIGLGLLHFQTGDASHFSVFINHFLDDIINLFLLFCVLLIGFILKAGAVLNLLLNEVFHAHALFNLSCFFISRNLVLYFFCAEHDLINVGILLLDK